ncbi:hypothetical protein MTER_16880 [Mycolicibacter terrae]|uniref:SCP domain-containing protein n=2 Tax=Mycolicibacter terrae TaxID=1788 RepID=A0AAD1HVJ4_9MYCO|nr:hypothetical protein MTER_16880 [Mycolicibacter terrae]SNV76776.1 Conserved protein of uncharacterised function, possible outer membrane protein [Mycolicibacter terrae]
MGHQLKLRPALALLGVAAALGGTGVAAADNDVNILIANNKRMNDSVIANVFTIQHNRSGCRNDVRPDGRLILAAQRHARDLIDNRGLDSDIGSDGSNPQERGEAAGYRGRVSETVAVHPALAISGVELINRWYNDPAALAIMADCANSQMGVWTENRIDRTVVVAVYGQPADPMDTTGQNVPLDPSPDYDMSDEVEFGNRWWAWILRGVYPPPGQEPR